MGKITLGHGSGGKIMHELIENMFFRYLGNDILNKADDSAIINISGKKVAFTTDTFVVNPIFFPGGDIGKLSVCGTINDLAVMGAVPQYISCGFIIEEGFDEADLANIVKSIAYWAREAGVKVVTGDTKVVEKNAADGIFINTSGIGVLKDNNNLAIDKIEIGDKVIINGNIGDHGIAVLSKREGIKFDSSIESDCAPLNKMIMEVLDAVDGVKFMRDPTRGGVATVLNEITANKNFGILIEEDKIPVSEGVRAACELLGFETLYIANEGKVVMIVKPSCEKRVLDILRKDRYGRNAASVGEITENMPGRVSIKTRYGVKRILDMLSQEAMPRIC